MTRSRFFAFLICLSACLFPYSLSAAETVVPVDSTQFFLDPGKETVLRFTAPDETPIPYRLVSEDGTLLAEGSTDYRDGKHAVPVTLPDGFAEILFPTFKAGGAKVPDDTPLRFGIVAVAPFPVAERDPFFCIDGALSWLVNDDRRREDYVHIAARYGIFMIRERLSWRAINPEEGRFDWDTGSRYDRLRQTAKAADVELLEVFHDAPAWIGYVGKFPEDLLKTAEAWEAIAEHWAPTWGALEIWNEPDIFFSGNLPADQYVPLVRALAFRLKHKGLETPLIGGSLAHFSATWLETASYGGMFTDSDGFSFHTYARAHEVEKFYKDMISVVPENRTDMPLYLTECGRPWKRGVDRPPRDQDLVSACDIVMKGVEARAMHIDRYFPFVYPYYDENDNNFSMMDKNGSPLRSMGAYLRMIRLLSGSEYLGGLGNAKVPGDRFAETAEVLDGPALVRVRAFRKPDGDKAANSEADRTILVFYTGDTMKPTTIKPALGRAAFLEATALTGEPVPIAEDGSLTFSGGLVYVQARMRTEGAQTDGTPGIADSRSTVKSPRGAEAAAAVISPITVVYRFDPEQVEPNSSGYRLRHVAADDVFPLKLHIHNFDDQARKLAFRAAGPEGSPVLKPGESEVLTVPARSFAEQTVLIDFGEAFARNREAKVRICYESAKSPGIAACPVQLVFFGEATREKMLAANPDALRLPIDEAARWRTNVAGIGKMRMEYGSRTTDVEKPADDRESPTKEKIAWKLDVEFGDGDRWVYPVFSLPTGAELSRYEGLIIHARCTEGKTIPRLMVYENGRAGYMTTDALFPADGTWHTIKIPFAALQHCTATPPDANQWLDLEQVRSFSIGGNTQESRFTLEVRDCLLY